MKLTLIFCVFLFVAGSNAVVDVLSLYPALGALQDAVTSNTEKINSNSQAINSNAEIINSNSVIGNSNTEKINSINLRSKVGFSSYLSADLGVSNGQKIRFDKTLYNDGGAYSTYTGVFTCPYDGVYWFTYFIGSRDSQELDAELVVNGVMKNWAVADGTEGGHDVQGGNAAVLKLHKYDQVWIGATPHGTKVIGSWRFSTFSGVLLS